MTHTARRLKVTLLPAALTLLVAACSGDLGTEPGPRALAARTRTVIYYGNCQAALGQYALPAPGWTPVFGEEFLGGLASWNVWYGGAFNNELQLYQSANLLGSASGSLSIVAKKETVDGPTSPYDQTPKTFNYTSGRIESATRFSASGNTPRVRMAAKIFMPSGYGMWPAFWSYGDPWPTQGEIDVVEARGNEPAVYQTNYFYGRRANVNLVRGAATIVNLLEGAWLNSCPHIFEVEWGQNSLTYYLDGTVVDLKTGGYIPSMFGKQQRVVVNLAVGGVFFGNLDLTKIVPGTMVVDWVRVFTHP